MSGVTIIQKRQKLHDTPLSILEDNKKKKTILCNEHYIYMKHSTARGENGKSFSEATSTNIV